MNKYIYLVVSCMFIFLSFFAFPFVRVNPSLSNIVITFSFILLALVSLWQFIRKVLYVNKSSKVIESQFRPVED